MDYIMGMHKTEVETPALLLDIEAAEFNIRKMADWYRDKKCNLRPHIKTHKLPLIAHKQIAAGAIGITCAKLSEAKIFAEHGINNILIANEIVGERKIIKLINLSRYVNLLVCIDDLDNARHISRKAKEMGAAIDVLVEVNVGINRCGVKPGRPALELVREISSLRNINFRGLMGYEGGMFLKDLDEKAEACRESNRKLVESKELIEKAGFKVEIVSAGGSNTYSLTGLYPGITEVQAGSYVTMDAHNKEYGLDFKQAITVLATVISVPENGRAVIDAGMKALSSDCGLPTCGDPRISVSELNEEHGHIKSNDSNINIKTGDKIELIPSHGCTTIPLFDEYIIVRQDIVESSIKICARGALT